jgi:hypothetical protein
VAVVKTAGGMTWADQIIGRRKVEAARVIIMPRFGLDAATGLGMALRRRVQSCNQHG